ncbi:MAG TPA: hypothetical protein VGD00_03310 [Solirubrobacteraceae bacterium]
MADLLAIYLNDHLAGAVAGCELAGRIAGQNKRDERFGPDLDGLAVEVREDRETLRELLRHLAIGEDRIKQLGTWTLEKIGRLKLNGSLLGYSPLSRVEELEAMRMAVTGKRLMWVALRELAPQDPRLQVDETERMIERADRQLETIERCHRLAVDEAFVAGEGKTAA